jgi:hypothetical protein
MIHMIQELFGQTLRRVIGAEVNYNKRDLCNHAQWVDVGQKSLMLVRILAKLRPNQSRKRLAPGATLFVKLVG